MSETKYYIYEVYNDVTQKRYIGLTRDLKSRMQHHFASLRRYNHPVPEMTKDCIKYGYGHFSFHLIDIVYGRINGFEKEDYYVRKYNTYVPEYGYNGKGSRYTESARRRYSVKTRKQITQEEV